MANEKKQVDETRRMIVLGGPALMGVASASVLTGCGGASSALVHTAAASPVFSPGAGTYSSAQSVSLSTPTPGATIYYTVDATVPTTASAVYASPIMVSSSGTIQAIAAASNLKNSDVASSDYTIDASMRTAGTPNFAPAGGTYSTAQTVTLSTVTAGATIHYTLDGTTPTASSAVYSAPLDVKTSAMIQAIAAASGMLDSAVASSKYTIDQTVTVAATPTFSPGGGTYGAAQTITLSSTSSGVTIHFTTNGTTPTASSVVYSAPIVVSSTETVQAIAIATGMQNSAVGSAKYTIDAITTAATPTFAPGGGTYSSAQTVTLSTVTSGATIHYTTDGTTPTASSAVYSKAITVAATETIHAIAIATGLQNSLVASAVYNITSATAATPTFSPVGGIYASAQTVTLSTTTAGATIHFTTDGSTPTASSAVYSAAITVSATETIQAIAVAAGVVSSSVGSARYTIGAATSGYDGMLSVSGGAFVNGSGKVVQLRGANAQGGFPFLMYPQSTRGNATDASGGIECGCDQPNGCNTAYLANWKFNCVRIGMNTANILGRTVYDSNGTVIVPSSSAWLSQLVTYVSQLNAIGLYVSLVLAWDSPGSSPPLGQDYMATQDNAIQAWEVITGLFGYPNGTALKKNGGTVDNKSVIFELFNEPEGVNTQLMYQGGFANLPYHCYGNSSETTIYPFPCTTPTGTFKPGENFTSTSGATGQIHCYFKNTTTGLVSSGTQFIHLRNGNSAISVPTGATIMGSTSGATVTVTSSSFGWYLAGYYQMLSAIRAAGAQNVCLIGGNGWCQDLSGFQTYAQPDPQPAGYSGSGWNSPQYGAAWHPYPPYTWVNAAAVASGGSGYAVNDTILLPMDESGDADSGNCYWQGQLKVTSVNGSSVSAVAPVTSYRVGIPGGINGQGNSGQFNFGYGAGIWAPTFCNVLPANPVPQYSGAGGQPGTSGLGATFNITWGVNSGFPMKANWPTVLAIKNAGYPVCITETGEHTGTGISGSPYMAQLTSWCDANEIGLVVYTYTPSAGWYDPQGYDYSLVLNTLSGSGSTQYRTPSPGYGQFMYQWFTNHA